MMIAAVVVTLMVVATTRIVSESASVDASA